MKLHYFRLVIRNQRMEYVPCSRAEYLACCPTPNKGAASDV